MQILDGRSFPRDSKARIAFGKAHGERVADTYLGMQHTVAFVDNFAIRCTSGLFSRRIAFAFESNRNYSDQR